MPEAPVRRVATLTRRQGLAGLALLGPVVLLTACTSEGTPADESGQPSIAGAGVAGLSEKVAAHEQELVARYASVISAFPSLSTPLGAIRDQHLAHAIELSDATPGAPAAVVVPSDQRAALGMLIAAERDAMRGRLADCVAAQDPDLARTLTFIAASEGSHVPALRDMRA